MVPLKDISDRLAVISRNLRWCDELAFEEWEEELLPSVSEQFPELNLIHEDDQNSIQTIAIGGHFGDRATISHLAVLSDAAPESGRRSGHGTVVTKAILEALKKVNVKVVHVIVTAGNHIGLNFWKKQGFVPVEDRILLECDRTENQRTYEDTPREGNTLRHPNGGKVEFGSFGVRGFIAAVDAPEENVPLLLHAALDSLHAEGLRRVHAFVPRENESLRRAFEKVGFKNPPGETTLERQIH